MRDANNKIFNFKRDCRGVISVIGASEIDKDTEEKSLEIGRLIAKNKYALVCGGLTGVMEFVCKGAKEEHGVTIGIIPSKEKSMANKYIDIAIPVPFSQARNIVVVLAGDVVVAIGGMAGTLNEISLAWIYEKPIVALSSVEGWSSKMANKKVDNRRPDIIYGAENPSEVINKVNELMKSNKSKNISSVDVF